MARRLTTVLIALVVVFAGGCGGSATVDDVTEPDPGSVGSAATAAEAPPATPAITANTDPSDPADVPVPSEVPPPADATTIETEPAGSDDEVPPTAAASTEAASTEAASTQGAPADIEFGDRFPEVLTVQASPTDGDAWRFSVTLSSLYDTPERYADAWRVLDADDNELGIRVLLHDHANEQPFTRSERIEVPPETTTVFVEGRDQLNGWSGQRFEFRLPNPNLATEDG